MRPDIEFAIYLAGFAFLCGLFIGTVVRVRMSTRELERIFYDGKVAGLQEAALLLEPQKKQATVTPIRRIK